MEREEDKTPFPVFYITYDGLITNVNLYAELLMNEMSASGIKKPGKFLIEKLYENSSVFKTYKGTYGIKAVLDGKAYKIYIITLAEFEQSLNELIDISSFQHEIKNPLTVIDGAAQIINNKSDNEYIKKCAEIIQKESERIKLLLNNVHFMSEMSISFSNISIFEILNELRNNISTLFKDIELRFRIIDGLTNIYADKQKLYIALQNIVKNACEAQGTGIIDIELTIEPAMKYIDRDSGNSSSMLRIAISDNGGGIDEKVNNRLFTPFFTTKNKGTGLGLIIAKEIVEKHKGRIEVSSIKGKGTTFFIFIPTRVCSFN